MEKLVQPFRLTVVALLIVALAVVYFIALYSLQIVEGEKYYQESVNNKVSRVTVPAARGSILDRYGRLLVQNRECNNLLINEISLFPDTEPETIARANAAILELCNTVTEFGDTYTDTLPVTKSPPFEYTSMTDAQRVFLDAYLADHGLDKSTTAVELLAHMRSRYAIDNSYTAEESRIISGIRYEINGRYSHGFATSNYIFAQDVSMELIARLMENDVPGFEVETSFVRVYATVNGPHLLGYVGAMTAEELPTYEKLDYPLNAQVGKDGAELAFEQYLHGVDGEARVTRTADGVITSTSYNKEPEPGNNVYLTIDIGLQEIVENALNTYILGENNERQARNDELDQYGGLEEDYEQLITGGAVVCVEVDSGEPLAIASWPTFDINRILDNEYYASLMQEENSSLYNRATMGLYAPGSTFKPCMAIAALTEGKITVNTPITDQGEYTKYADANYAPRCWIYPGNHGSLTVSDAITASCNYFFYTCADYLGITAMAKYAKLFGLGESTGIELPEFTGVMSSDEYAWEHFGREMYNGETIAAGIGQSYSLFSPLQLAEYCATVANGGTRHSASLLKFARSFDYSELVYEPEREVLSVVESDQKNWDAVHAGMYGYTTKPEFSNTVTKEFEGTSYTVAAKTGTAQIGKNIKNNGCFICYAPYEDPEIAIAVVVERAGAGASTAGIARTILDYYFSFQGGTVTMEAENTLLK